jgi:hypothetical protein
MRFVYLYTTVHNYWNGNNDDVYLEYYSGKT